MRYSISFIILLIVFADVITGWQQMSRYGNGHSQGRAQSRGGRFDVVSFNDFKNQHQPAGLMGMASNRFNKYSQNSPYQAKPVGLSGLLSSRRSVSEDLRAKTLKGMRAAVPGFNSYSVNKYEAKKVEEANKLMSMTEEPLTTTELALTTALKTTTEPLTTTELALTTALKTTTEPLTTTEEPLTTTQEQKLTTQPLKNNETSVNLIKESSVSSDSTIIPDSGSEKKDLLTTLKLTTGAPMKIEKTIKGPPVEDNKAPEKPGSNSATEFQAFLMKYISTNIFGTQSTEFKTFLTDYMLHESGGFPETESSTHFQKFLYHYLFERNQATPSKKSQFRRYLLAYLFKEAATPTNEFKKFVFGYLMDGQTVSGELKEFLNSFFIGLNKN